MLIWGNLILDLHEILKFQINLKSNYSKLTLEYAADTSDKDYSNDIQGWPLAKVLNNKNIKYKEQQKSFRVWMRYLRDLLQMSLLILNRFKGID